MKIKKGFNTSIDAYDILFIQFETIVPEYNLKVYQVIRTSDPIKDLKIPDNPQTETKNIRCMFFMKYMDIRFPLSTHCEINQNPGSRLFLDAYESFYMPCPEGCKTCKIVQNQCLECEIGYFLSDSECLPCHSSCKTCEVFSFNCQKCQDESMTQLLKVTSSSFGFNVCNHCLQSGCTLCVFGKCFQCIFGFTMIESRCLDCSDPVNAKDCGIPVTPEFQPSHDPNSDCSYGFHYDDVRKICKPTDYCKLTSVYKQIDLELCSACLKETEHSYDFSFCLSEFLSYEELFNYYQSRKEFFEQSKVLWSPIIKIEKLFQPNTTDQSFINPDLTNKENPKCYFFNSSLQICQLCFTSHFFNPTSKSCEPCQSNCDHCESKVKCLKCDSQYELKTDQNLNTQCAKKNIQTIQVDTSICKEMDEAKSNIDQLENNLSLNVIQNCQSLDCSQCSICQINQFPICGNCPKCQNKLKILISYSNNTLIELNFGSDIIFSWEDLPDTLSNLEIEDINLQQKIIDFIDSRIPINYEKHILVQNSESLLNEFFPSEETDLKTKNSLKLLKLVEKNDIAIPVPENPQLKNNSIFIFRRIKIGESYPLNIQIGSRLFKFFDKEETYSNSKKTISFHQLVLNPSIIFQNLKTDSNSQNKVSSNKNFKLSQIKSENLEVNSDFKMKCDNIQISIIQIKVSNIRFSVENVVSQPINIILLEKLQCEELVRERSVGELITQTGYTSVLVVAGNYYIITYSQILL